MKNVGDLKRAKNPSFPKGKLGHVHPQNLLRYKTTQIDVSTTK